MFLSKRRRSNAPNKSMSQDDFMALCKKNFAAALQYNKLWRGNLIPLRPIRKNIFCLTDTVYDVELLKNDLINLQKKTKTGWESKEKSKYNRFSIGYVNDGKLDNKEKPKGTWTSITLKGYQGQLQPFLEKHNLIENGSNPYKYTDNMQYCDYIKKIFSEIELLGSEIYLVRLLKLNSHAHVGFHTDNMIFADKFNIIRCHLPIITNAQCTMFLGYPAEIFPGGTQMNKYKANMFWSRQLDVGKIWYTNVNCLHAVENKGDTDRVHLVFDIKPTQEMLKKIYG